MLCHGTCARYTDYDEKGRGALPHRRHLFTALDRRYHVVHTPQRYRGLSQGYLTLLEIECANLYRPSSLGESSRERGLGMRLSIMPEPQLIDTMHQLSYI